MLKKSPNFFVQLRYCYKTCPQPQLPAEADVVVVGGGSIGCNTIYHLTKLNVKNCVLLERDKLTCGTTWHTAGLLWRIRSTDIDVQLVNRTRELNTKILEAETGIHTGWIQNGGLYIASRKERLQEITRYYTLGKAMGIECHMVSPSEIKDLFPVMQVDDLEGGLYTPGDGLLDPSSLMQALTKAAEKGGAKVIEGCPVTAVKTKNDGYGKRVTGVVTPFGEIKTQAVVCCAGAWSPRLGAMADVPIPLTPFKHSYIITESIPGIEKVPNCRDPDRTYYLRLQGNALEVGGFENAAPFADNLPDNFSFSMFDLNWDAFGEIMEGAIHRVPMLKDTGIKKEVCGPESFTPDHQPLFGEAPQCRGFYLGCGLNSQGMMYGGGFGWQLAEWIVHGRPSLHMGKYDIRRYNPQLVTNKKWVDDKSHEGLRNNYSIGWPHDAPFAGRNKFKDPLYDTLLEQGSVYEEKIGWERPSWFAPDCKPAPVLDYDYYGAYGHEQIKNYFYWDRLRMGYSFEIPRNHEIIENESLNCRNRVALFNMSSFGKFYITGPDSQKAVDWIFSADMHKKPDQTVYTLLLNDRAGVEGDVTVSVLSPGSNQGPHDPKFEGTGFYVAAGGSMREHAKYHILNELQDKGFNVDFKDVTEKMTLLSLQGPYSREILQKLANVDLSDSSFPFSTHKTSKVAGYPCRLLRLSFVGELGFELHVPWQHSLAIYKALMAEGQQYGIVNAGYRSIGALSAEKGFVLWGVDLRHSDNPFEVGLGFACKLKTKTAFKGRDELLRQKEHGPRKRLVCVTLDDHVALNGWEAIYRDDVIVGILRRGDHAFFLNSPIGYGCIARPDGEQVTPDWINSGKYSVEVLGKMYPANVQLKSPFDPQGLRMKGIYEKGDTHPAANANPSNADYDYEFDYEQCG